MEQVIARCCGLDVHQETVAACVRVPGPSGKRLQHLKTFGTTLADLLALRDCLEAEGVAHVAMESTAVYWKPVYYVLEERVTCLLVNAAHLKRVPAAKPTCRTAPGSPSCWSTASCGGVSCRQLRSGSSATSRGTGRS